MFFCCALVLYPHALDAHIAFRFFFFFFFFCLFVFCFFVFLVFFFFLFCFVFTFVVLLSPLLNVRDRFKTKRVLSALINQVSGVVCSLCDLVAARHGACFACSLSYCCV